MTIQRFFVEHQAGDLVYVNISRTGQPTGNDKWEMAIVNKVELVTTTNRHLIMDRGQIVVHLNRPAALGYTVVFDNGKTTLVTAERVYKQLPTNRVVIIEED